MTIKRTNNQQPKLKGGNNMTTKYVTILTNYDNRHIRKEIKLEPPYQINTIPYGYMKQRYKDTVSILKQLRKGTDQSDILIKQLEKLIGTKATKYSLYRVYNEQQVMTEEFKYYLRKTIYNKVIYWNIYNNNSRLFLTILDLDELTYETSSSININKYFHPQEEQFIKALLDTDAKLVIKDKYQTKLLAVKTKKGDHSWDYKNYQYNEIIRDIIYTTAQPYSSKELVHPTIINRFKDLQTKYNLETSERTTLVDYTTRFYTDTTEAIRTIDVETYSFLKENGLLEERIDIDEIEERLAYLKEKIKDLYYRDPNRADVLIQEHIQLEAKLSREYIAKQSVGYNPEIG